MSLFSYKLPLEEKPILVIKTHWTNYLTYPLRWLGLALLIGFAITFAFPFWWGTKEGQIGITACFGIISVVTVLKYWKYFLTTYIVTPCRVVDVTQEKVLSRVITEVNLEDLDEVVAKRKPFFGWIIGRGNIYLRLKNKKGEIVLFNVKSPRKLKESIEKIKNDLVNKVSKEGEECDVTLTDDKEYKVPLTYSYYGDKKEALEGGKKLSIIDRIRARKNKEENKE